MKPNAVWKIWTGNDIKCFIPVFMNTNCLNWGGQKAIRPFQDIRYPPQTKYAKMINCSSSNGAWQNQIYKKGQTGTSLAFNGIYSNMQIHCWQDYLSVPMGGVKIWLTKEGCFFFLSFLVSTLHHHMGIFRERRRVEKNGQKRKETDRGS